MARVKKGVNAHKRHKKVLKNTVRHTAASSIWAGSTRRSLTAEDTETTTICAVRRSSAIYVPTAA